MDAALDWQHANVRGGAAHLVFHSVLTRNMGGPFPADKLLAKQALNTLTAALQVPPHVCMQRWQTQGDALQRDKKFRRRLRNMTRTPNVILPTCNRWV